MVLRTFRHAGDGSTALQRFHHAEDASMEVRTFRRAADLPRCCRHCMMLRTFESVVQACASMLEFKVTIWIEIMQWLGDGRRRRDELRALAGRMLRVCLAQRAGNCLPGLED